MWNRKELKEKAKAAFKQNYWKCVIAAIILGLLTGATVSTYSARSGVTALWHSGSQYNAQTNGAFNFVGEEMTEDEAVAVIAEAISNAAAESGMTNEEYLAAFLTIAAVVAGAVLLFSLIAEIVKIFVWNLFYIGGCRFYVTNSKEKASLKELLYGFSHGYGRNVAAMLLRDIFIALWSLLLVIPGIVKAYGYSMAYYIKIDHPDYDWRTCLSESQRMMKGHKMQCFLLDLSFIGWFFVSALCLAVGSFWVIAWADAATAEFYEALSSEPQVLPDWEVR